MLRIDSPHELLHKKRTQTPSAGGGKVRFFTRFLFRLLLP